MSKMAHDLKKMDNPGYSRDLEKGTELGLVKKTNGVPVTSSKAGPSHCRPEVCQAARNRVQGSGSGAALADSPWHTFKTISLISIIVLLIVWIIVFTTLSQLKLL